MTMEPDEFLKTSILMPVVDVRSPAEYEKGHIPGALNIPLFNNEERAEVGTIYKKSGRQAAIFKGLDIVGPNMSRLLKKALSVARDGHLLMHCWRGGMRSESMAWLFRQGGIETHILAGGYRAYRRYIREYSGFHQSVVVLGGMTGSGKTEILQHIQNNNEQVIDLEAIANHKGSAFGDIGQAPQPSSEQFENDLAAEWLKLDAHRQLWLEDESRSIGTVTIPDPVFLKIIHAPVIFIELPLEKRISRIVNEYAGFSKLLLEKAIHRISKRLGGKNVKDALTFLYNDNFEMAVEIILRYYDKAYLNSLHQRKDIQVFRLKLPKDDPEKNAKEVLDFYYNQIAGKVTNKTHIW
jgi:tRNA 2-selenouridine synthase